MAQAQKELDPKKSTGKVLLRKKLNAEIRKTADMKEGDTFQGKYVDFNERPWNQIDKETGEIETKAIPQFIFEKENGERVILMGDAGLKNCMGNAGVSKGDFIEIVKMGMQDLGGGRRVNQYDIFQLTAQ